MTRTTPTLIATVLAASLSAQSGSTALHAAWLQETLDLDIQGACRAYLTITRDDKIPALERQIAAARIEELRRLGAPAVGSEPSGVALPTGIATPLGTADSDALQKAVKAALSPPSSHPTQSEADIEAKPPLPPLRPLVQLVIQMAQQPTRTDRSMQSRFQAPESIDATRVIERVRAFEIVRADLSGRLQEADQIRQRAFPGWNPQPWPEDKATAWSKVRKNLVQWQQDRQISNAEREALEQLLRRLDEDAREGAERALQRVDRLPVFSERLHSGNPSLR